MTIIVIIIIGQSNSSPSLAFFATAHRVADETGGQSVPTKRGKSRKSLKNEKGFRTGRSRLASMLMEA
jgi:hypothetical protein